MRKAFFLLLVPTLASAEPRRIELGVAVGGHAFSTNTELGVADHMSEPGAASSGLLGVRVALPLKPRIAVEGEAMIIPTEDDVLGEQATVLGLRAHARFDILTGRLKPFLVAGVGMHVVSTDSPQMDNDTDRAYHWGGGVRFALTDTLDMRFDARHLIVPDRTRDGATSDYEVTAGVTYRFGKAQKPIIIRESSPPTVVTKVIDLDRDDDGFVDAKDTCPDQAEIRNSYRDEDGCPDQIIQELAGIGFELNSAQIDSASAPLLEKAFVILKDNPGISIEISGHTSSEGDIERNLTLSLKRAEAVKSYLTKRGIADGRILTIGHGSDVPLADNATEEGRQKNRRIEFRILLPTELP